MSAKNKKFVTWISVAVGIVTIVGGTLGFVVNESRALAGHVALPQHEGFDNIEDAVHVIDIRCAVLEAGQARTHEDIQEIKANQKSGFASIERAIERLHQK